ncbi:uncharacterized protein C4H3.14c-like [Nicotiana tomentosiformis]|uniref:uncharacterized protein C4H3.14c-like n=1 Tax=Nicotiana tomentosiformis TaxID=4098 RepID=UPI00388CE5F9
MAKISKTVSQKEVASSSRPAGGEDAAEPRPEEFIPVGCSTVSDFKRPYSERAWVEISKARWEAHSHGLGKDIAMRPPSGDKEVHVPKQVKEKKRKDVPSSPVSEKKKPAKKSRKPKGPPSVMLSESIRRLRDEPEEEEEELAGVWANVVIQQSSESAEASMLHHEAFLRIREEHEDEVQDLTEKSDSYKLLSEKLRADLAAARDEHEEMAKQVFRILHDSEDELEITTNNPILQVRQRLEQIRRLNSQVDELMTEGEKFKKNMDILASKKEAVQAQLESAEAQLRAAKENASVHIERVKELQSGLDLATSNKASLANELEVAKAKSMVEHAKWKARREALEEVSAQGFNDEAENENAKAEENKARRLAIPEEDSDSSSESEGGEDPKDVASEEDQAI